MLNNKLDSVEWGGYSFKSIFNNIFQGRRLKKDDQLPGDIPFVMAGVTNSGVVNYISNPVAIFPENSITIDIFGNTFYRDYAFGAGDDTGVYWSDENIYSKETMKFFAISMNKSMESKFDFGKKLRSSQSSHLKMMLPVKNGEIDIGFMDSFITELEAERIAELETYLTVAGLKNYELTPQDQGVLDEFENHNLLWGTYNLKALFGPSTRGKRLKSSDRLSGDLPFVTAGEFSEGVSAFICNDVTVFPENTTTIDMFGSAKYRNYEYGADDHIAVVHTENLPGQAAIFITTSIHKSSYTGKFDYGRNFYAKDADNLMISLPVKNDKPDFSYMSDLISAIQKLVIKDVVRYTEKKMAAYKHVVAR
ncbi:restriction endonuclease [Salmonella enterica]|nr:restriction endonuclease [Salmonella enterica]EGA2770395.1 restriction endonuclease [Salmonella enterica]